MPGSADAQYSINKKKYKENYEAIFGKRKSILDEAPELEPRGVKTAKGYRPLKNRKVYGK